MKPRGTAFYLNEIIMNEFLGNTKEPKLCLSLTSLYPNVEIHLALMLLNIVHFKRSTLY